MKRLIPLLALVVLVSACKIRLDVNLEIAEDESGNVSFALALDEELRSLVESDDTTFGLTESLPADWTSEDYVDGEFEGVRVATEFASIDSFADRIQGIADEELGDNAAPDFLTQLQIERDGDLFNFSADLTGLEGGLGGALAAAGDGQALDASFLGQLIDIRLVLTLPGEIVTSNADVTADSTLTWNLTTADDGKVLTAQSTVAQPASNNIVIIAVAVLALIIVGVILSRRRSSTDTAVPQEPAS